MLHYDFMRNALAAGTIVAVMCGFIGVFVIARQLSFIAHTFSHIGFSGASFAVWAGWNPIGGLLLFSAAGALAIGGFGVKLFRREATISVVLSLFLGLGLLFISLSAKKAAAMTALLFGSVVGISAGDVREIVGLSALVAAALALFYKPLKFDSFDPAGAQAAGLPARIISIGFLLLLAVAVSEAILIVGSLLVFTLMTAPAAAARQLTGSVGRMALLSVLLGVLGVWGGLALSYVSNAPVSFYITALETLFYFGALGWSRLRERRRPAPDRAAAASAASSP